MITIQKLENGAVLWGFDASNPNEGARMAHARGEQDLANTLYRMELTPRAGRHELGGGFVLESDGDTWA